MTGRSFDRKRGCEIGRIQMFHWKGFPDPGMETARQGPDPVYSQPSQKQRRPGAPDLAGSITTQDDIAVVGNLMVIPFELLERKGQSARDRKRIRREFERRPNIQDQ